MGSHVEKMDTSLLPIADEEHEHEHDNQHALEDQHGSSQGLKRTCEECTRSKVRCSGPSKGICDRCALRKTECVFRNKLKRGPQTSAATSRITFQKKPKEQPKALKQAKAAAPLAVKQTEKVVASSDYPPIQPLSASSTSSGSMTWHERRCWNVFFSTFKHQNRRENPTSWCWFALQLDKLRKDLERRQNTAALERLEAWMVKLHTKSSALTLQTSQSCMFAPQLCAGCSAAALLAKNRPKAQVRPADTSGESSYIFSPGEKPFIEFEMDSDGARINQINDRFTSTFGHTRESLSAALKWSDGGGFLPWGGDLVARLLWSEADVLIYLQVLAVKFQALGPPRHDHEDPYHVMTRDVLSAYIFDVRMSSGKNNDFNELVVPCMVKSLHRETLVGCNLKITVMLEFEPMGPMKPGPETPESLKEAMEAARLRRGELDTSLDSVKETSLDGLSKPSAATRQDSLSLMLPSPREDLALLDPSWDWETFESSVGEEGKTPAPVQRSSSYGSSNGGLQTFEDSVLVPTVKDEDWLASLLEWTE